MQLHVWSLALMALGMNMQVARAHLVPSPLALPNLPDMDDTSVVGLNVTESGLEARDSIPHDVPDHPHCTFKGTDSLFFMVFSKDFGRHDETSKAGCGSDMLHHLRKGTSRHRCIIPAAFITAVFTPSLSVLETWRSDKND